MLGLLLIALTAAVSAVQYTTEETEKKVSTNISILYKCDVCKGYRHRGNMYDAEKKRVAVRPITSEDSFQYSFYHLRPGASEPDPELDELMTVDSVFTYSGEYRFYAVVEPSLNYKGA